MSANIPLGKLAADDAGRDAIHIAVAPVIASERLHPGMDIGILIDGRASDRGVKHIGIVDPYLEKPVERGQRFYLCLYPNTITSLRHHWVHPAFKDEEPVKPTTKSAAKAESEAWLREYAQRFNPQLVEDGGVDLAYKTLIQDMKDGTITYHGRDMHSRGELVDAEELKRHTEVVIGRPIDYDKFEYFSCTC